MRIFEMMTRAKCSGYTVRVWTGVERFRKGPDPNVLEACQAMERMEIIDAEAIANNICELPNINAVEVTDQLGDGGLIYPEWP